MTMFIKVKIVDGKSIEVGCTEDGRHYVMSDPVNVNNVAGMLAMVSCEMLKHNNKKYEERIDRHTGSSDDSPADSPCIRPALCGQRNIACSDLLVAEAPEGKAQVDRHDGHCNDQNL